MEGGVEINLSACPAQHDRKALFLPMTAVMFRETSKKPNKFCSIRPPPGLSSSGVRTWLQGGPSPRLQGMVAFQPGELYFH